MEQADLDYRRALEKAAQIEEALALQLALLADEMERQGKSDAADALQQASHQHRAASIKSRAIAASLEGH